MKKIVVNDTNVFIDLLDVGLLDDFFCLPWEIHTTDLVMLELLREGQKDAVSVYEAKGTLHIAKFEFDEFMEINNIHKKFKSKTNVSLTDCSVWYYAKQNSYTLLTGDRKLRNHPWDYTDLLLQYDSVIAPDLSQYTDMDYSERLSNNYWNKVFTAYWQNRNVNIYPNVTWSLPDSYEYSLAGLPRKSVIAINSMGIQKYNFSTSLWLDGYRFMVDALEPICILRYGPRIYGEDESISLYLDNKQIKIFENGSKRK